ncbi:MAG: PCRF domain-containing protein, partial [Oscillospiraceae bacterium]|nr:PCRF domain-containing protein [Oscillospiraceae bacterium]
MLQYDELRLRLTAMRPDIDDFSDAIGLEKLKEELAELEEKSADQEFWSDLENSSKVLQRIKRIKDKIEQYHELDTNYNDTLDMILMANEEEDESMLEELTNSVNSIEADL